MKKVRRARSDGIFQLLMGDDNFIAALVVCLHLDAVSISQLFFLSFSFYGALSVFPRNQ